MSSLLSRLRGLPPAAPQPTHYAVGPLVTRELVLEALAHLPALPLTERASAVRRARLHVCVSVPRPGSHFTPDGELRRSCVDLPIPAALMAEHTDDATLALAMTNSLAGDVAVTRVWSSFDWARRNLASVTVAFTPDIGATR